MGPRGYSSWGHRGEPLPVSPQLAHPPCVGRHQVRGTEPGRDGPGRGPQQGRAHRQKGAAGECGRDGERGLPGWLSSSISEALPRVTGHGTRLRTGTQPPGTCLSSGIGSTAGWLHNKIPIPKCQPGRRWWVQVALGNVTQVKGGSLAAGPSLCSGEEQGCATWACLRAKRNGAKKRLWLSQGRCRGSWCC